MKKKLFLLYPVQPFFVLRTDKYFKKTCAGTNISHFYKFRTTPDEITSIAVPDGTIDIIFECNKAAPSASVIGFLNSSGTYHFKPVTDYFGIRFMPASLSHFINISANELMNQIVPLQELMHTPEAMEKIAAEANFYQQVNLFHHYFSQVIKSDFSQMSPSLVRDILTNIYEARGMVRMNELENSTFYSKRHINRTFKSHTGISPQYFAKYVRFQMLIQEMNRSNKMKLTDVSQSYGYYDQSHFLQDFKKFTNLSPTNYTKIILPEYQKNKIILL
ncbi:MAG: helix-turn-helix domain-containing protein [Lachnospiraceae bacterium]